MDVATGVCVCIGAVRAGPGMLLKSASRGESGGRCVPPAV